MASLKPYADDATSVQIGELTLENGQDCVAMYGNLDLTRDRTGLAHARALKAVLDEVVRVQEAEPHLRGKEPGRWFARLELEHENLVAALSWLLERAGTSAADEGDRAWAEQAMRLCGALYWFWNIHGYYREGRSFLERALSMRGGVSVSVQVKVLYAAIEMAITQDDFRRAEALCRGSLALSQELESNLYKASILFQLGFVSWARCRYEESWTQFEKAAALFQEMGDTWNYARTLAYLARAIAAQGEYDQAWERAEQRLKLSRKLDNKGRIAIALSELARIRFLSEGDLDESLAQVQQSLELFRELGDAQYIAYLNSFLGEIHLMRGEQVQARALLEESVTTLKELGDRWGTSEALLILARVTASQGELAEAHAYYQESLALLQEIEAKNLIASALDGEGAVLAAQGEPEWAARLWGLAQEIRETIGAPLPPVYREEYERALASARSQLGEEVFASALAQGRTLTVEQALVSRSI